MDGARHAERAPLRIEFPRWSLGLFMNVERSLGFQGFHEYAPDTVNEYEVNVNEYS